MGAPDAARPTHLTHFTYLTFWPPTPTPAILLAIVNERQPVATNRPMAGHPPLPGADPAPLRCELVPGSPRRSAANHSIRQTRRTRFDRAGPRRSVPRGGVGRARQRLFHRLRLESVHSRCARRNTCGERGHAFLR